jgi:Protein of unknown function (DUF2934)
MKAERSTKPPVQEHREEQTTEPNSPSDQRSPALSFTAFESKGNDDPQKQQIRELAYKLYEEGGRIDGHDVEHWLKAESIVRRTKKSAA